MPEVPPRDAARKIRKLRQLAADLREGESYQVTRLTVVKGLCADPAVANRSVAHLARETLDRVEQGHRRSRRLPADRTAPTGR